MTELILTAERLREVLDYDPEIGVFTWRIQPRARTKVGDEAGYLTPSGYLQIKIDQRKHFAHRLVFLYVYGRFPKEDTDHINGRRDDNRRCNLREATRSENMQNVRRARSHNKAGFLGVLWNSQRNKWMAEINVFGKKIYLGLFATPELAHEAYLVAKRELHHYGNL